MIAKKLQVGLPKPDKAFVNRWTELQHLEGWHSQMVGDTFMVSGAAGVGKSALALRLFMLRPELPVLWCRRGRLDLKNLAAWLTTLSGAPGTIVCDDIDDQATYVTATSILQPFMAQHPLRLLLIGRLPLHLAQLPGIEVRPLNSEAANELFHLLLGDRAVSYSDTLPWLENSPLAIRLMSDFRAAPLTDLRKN